MILDSYGMIEKLTRTEHEMPDKLPTSWYEYIVGALVAIVLGGIKWYLSDLKTLVLIVTKKVESIEHKLDNEVKDINKRIDTHIEKGD